VTRLLVANREPPLDRPPHVGVELLRQPPQPQDADEGDRRGGEDDEDPRRDARASGGARGGDRAPREARHRDHDSRQRQQHLGAQHQHRELALEQLERPQRVAADEREDLSCLVLLGRRHGENSAVT